ncbi:hypothetical protein SAMN02799630_03014 [Paenibacillus sp. UNCCL117]|uniref:hypothetical protein n=1 Tax=unclassified Paenibacillus TaxID=185978 RepID=UPI000886495B|nr:MULTISPECIES: hypothetical protein [unclassified Paenibacillus]SDE22670.1 hypothetical protein SAMN04488602_12242 [Paenibacillus sp. cl123]SFW42887.1 hypothetical protein SAMN02799630_03014 [Paenibacillus sp. UNCCL117]
MIWYYGLIVIGAIIAGCTVYRKGNAGDWLTYFLLTTAWTWVGEAIVLFVFDAYAYKPGFYQDPFAENIIGHIIANSALWASIAVWVMYFQSSYLVIGLIAIGFMGVEELFLKAGVYNQHWWQTYMTGIISFGFLIAVKKWFTLLHETKRKSPRIIVFWTIAWVILQTPTSVLMLFDKQFFRVHWVENIYRDSTLFSGFLYHILMASIIIVFMYVPKNKYWMAAPFLMLVAADAILLSAGVLIFYHSWNLTYLICIRAASLLIICMLERFTLNGVRVENKT